MYHFIIQIWHNLYIQNSFAEYFGSSQCFAIISNVTANNNLIHIPCMCVCACVQIIDLIWTALGSIRMLISSHPYQHVSKLFFFLVSKLLIFFNFIWGKTSKYLYLIWISLIISERKTFLTLKNHFNFLFPVSCIYLFQIFLSGCCFLLIWRKEHHKLPSQVAHGVTKGQTQLSKWVCTHYKSRTLTLHKVSCTCFLPSVNNLSFEFVL